MRTQYIFGLFVAVTRNPDVCGVARKRTCCTSITVQYGPGPDKGHDSDYEIAAIYIDREAINPR